MSDEVTVGFDDDEKPARRTKDEIQSELESEVHTEALQRYNLVRSALLEERQNCLQDRRMVQLPKAQWESLEEQFGKKPMMVVSMLRKAHNDVCDDFRAVRMDAVFSSKDGTPSDELADTCSMLFRADMQDSPSGQAKYNAFKESSSGGYGAVAVTTRYEDPGVDPEEKQDPKEPQRIGLRIVVDADTSVYFDPDSKLQDKSDAEWAFLITSMSYAAYEKEYGDSPTTWPKSVLMYPQDWYTPRVVYRAEYYVKEWQKYTEHTYRGIGPAGDEPEVTHTDEDLENDEDLARTLEATGFREVSERKRRRCKVHKWFMSGARVLKDYGLIAGSEIPLIPMYGQLAYIENVERCSGIVRDVQDVQRLLNVLVSKIVELHGYSGASVPIFTEEQILGHTEQWKNANTIPAAFHTINSVVDPVSGQKVAMGPLGYTKPPEIPQATAVLITLVQQFMKDIMRTGTDNEKVKSHVSGTALEMTQTAIDRKSSEYIDNAAVTEKRIGEVWLSMAPEVYGVPGRKLKGIRPNKQTTQIELHRPMIGADQMPYVANDLSKAKFDVTVDVGPSSQSRRDAIVRTLLAMLPAVPADLQSIIGLEIIAHVQMEGSESLSKYAHQKLVEMGVETATPEEAQQLAQKAQSAKPSPVDQLAMAEAQQAQADAAKAQADIALIEARTVKEKADTIVALAGIQLDKRKQAESEAATLSDAHLAHKASAVSTAQTLHGMLTSQAPAAPQSDGSGQ